MHGTRKKVDERTNDSVLYATYFSTSITDINISQQIFIYFMKTLIIGHGRTYEKNLDTRCSPIDVDEWFNYPYD